MKICVFVLFITGFIGCTGLQEKRSGADVTLVFNVQLDRKVYELSDFGEAPQLAIWLENIENGEVRTLFVTRRTGKGDFEGKAECPVSLPIWIGAFRMESGRSDFPTSRNPARDAVTGATPKKRELKVRMLVPETSRWYYYVEVNVSTDYNPSFPAVHPDGMFDSQGNGQPSIVYRGEIKAIAGNHSTPELVGRSEQLYFSTIINNDLTGIENARNILSEVKVSCISE